MNNQQCTLEKKTEIILKTADTEAEKRAVYHFRYKVYVAEMDKHRIKMNVNQKLISDPLDDWGINIYAKSGDTIIGVNRINIGTKAEYGKEILKCLDLNTFNHPLGIQEQTRFALLTKLMVDKAYRNSTLLYLLMRETYHCFVTHDVQYGFGGCNPHLLRLYEQIGLHRYTRNFIDEGYGLLFPLVMLADDVDHFRRVRSPLYRIARKKTCRNEQQVQWFHQTFIENSQTVNSQKVTPDALWLEISSRLHANPLASIQLLNGLTEEEAKVFLHECASIVACYPGDLLTIQGETSYSHNILLSGRLKSLTYLKPEYHYQKPGSHFGADGLAGHHKHTETIESQTESQILILTGLSFQRYSNSHFDTAHKIIQNGLRLARSPYDKNSR